MRKLQDGILEEQVIKNLIKQSKEEEETNRKRVWAYNRRITEIEEQLTKPDIRTSAKRNLKEWLKMFKDKRDDIMNINNLKGE